MSTENPLWGAPHTQDELALLGHQVADSTVAKYMVHTPNPGRQQSWRSFLKNHRNTTAACDFFTVPTPTSKTLFCFIVLSHDRGKIVDLDVTEHPTAEWTAQQIREAFPGDGREPRYLIRDRDSVCGDEFVRQVKAMAIEPVITGRECPWQHAYRERLIGTIRRECTGHLIPLGERHSLRSLLAFQNYYNKSRTHGALAGNSPIARAVDATGRLVSDPVLGGVHHRDRRAG